MPVVPINRPVRQAPSLPKPDDPWLLMAAAQMDAQGRLMEPEATEPDEDDE